ncbi:hypothetical protein QBC36DRAFT_391346 [Triangularia setosa]|uniref:Protein kinase domain-containing protein n=1 Tax=Triangularia setosa TaxID=2587417 RepID=A0AAN7A2L4_9PEZI|nr:hypothetical protein QBC36DRAFT_391346 [Podospora setosa]
MPPLPHECPRPRPHPLALFLSSLVVTHSCNGHLASVLNNGTLAPNIDFHIRSQPYGTLATLRHRETNIFVEGSSIAKLQCFFEIDLGTSMVMLYDRSHGQTGQLFGDHAIAFQYGRLRKVMIQEGLNDIVGMGGVGENLVTFQLKWHQGPLQTMERNPRLAWTVDLSETVLPSQMETRPHTPGSQKLKMRNKKMAELGTGQFGTVHKAIDVDLGRLVAVKMLR